MRVLSEDDPHAVVRSLDLAPHLRTHRLGRVVEIHEKLGSTNDRALELARLGATAGVTVVAVEQSAGRGRHGRSWHSPAGAGLYASIVIRPDISPRLAPALTLVAGVAVREALAEICSAPVALKWPNDLLASEAPHRGRKLAGLLLEMNADQHRIEHAVVGVGINLLEVPLPEDLSLYAVSLETLSGQRCNPALVLGTVCNHLERRLLEAEAQGLSPATKAWTRNAFGLGQQASLHDDKQEHEGFLRGIAEDGALLLDTAQGRRTFYRGDLQLRDCPKPPR